MRASPHSSRICRALTLVERQPHQHDHQRTEFKRTFNELPAQTGRRMVTIAPHPVEDPSSKTTPHSTAVLYNIGRIDRVAAARSTLTMLPFPALVPRLSAAAAQPAAAHRPLLTGFVASSPRSECGARRDCDDISSICHISLWSWRKLSLFNCFHAPDISIPGITRACQRFGGNLGYNYPSPKCCRAAQYVS